MYLFFIGFAIYGAGCVLAMIFFLVGRSPALIEHNRPWPIIFLWPFLVFWPIHALAGYFIKWKTSRPEKVRTANTSKHSELPKESSPVAV